MSVEYTPVHKETGIAYPVYVTPEDFVVKKNRQHHKEHPSTREEFKDIYGLALRKSSTQQLPDQLHFESYKGGYHRIFWGPEKTAETPSEKITKALLQIGGVIPREAIQLTGDGYEIRSLTNEEHDFLSHPLLTHIEGRTSRQRDFRRRDIGNAIIHFALEQDISELFSSKLINKYRNTLDVAREAELGNQIIYSSVDEVMKPALAQFEKAKNEGMVSARRIGLRAVVRSFLPSDHLKNYYELIRHRIENLPQDQIDIVQSRKVIRIPEPRLAVTAMAA